MLEWELQLQQIQAKWDQNETQKKTFLIILRLFYLILLLWLNIFIRLCLVTMEMMAYQMLLKPWTNIVYYEKIGIGNVVISEYFSNSYCSVADLCVFKGTGRSDPRNSISSSTKSAFTRQFNKEAHAGWLATKNIIFCLKLIVFSSSICVSF